MGLWHKLCAGYYFCHNYTAGRRDRVEDEELKRENQREKGMSIIFSFRLEID